jgi:hypothetical protein
LGAGEHASMVDRLCPAPSTSRAVTRPPCAPRTRDDWYAEPVKVFDNLYFVGMTEFATWAVTTSEGIIVIDPIFDYSVEAEAVDGQKLTLGDTTLELYLTPWHTDGTVSTPIPVTDGSQRHVAALQ